VIIAALRLLSPRAILQRCALGRAFKRHMLKEMPRYVLRGVSCAAPLSTQTPIDADAQARPMSVTTAKALDRRLLLQVTEAMPL